MNRGSPLFSFIRNYLSRALSREILEISSPPLLPPFIKEVARGRRISPLLPPFIKEVVVDRRISPLLPPFIKEVVVDRRISPLF